MIEDIEEVMINSMRPETFSALVTRNARLFCMALVCWVISVEAHAGTRTVIVSTPMEFVSAIDSPGAPEFGENDELLILLSGGVFAMNRLLAGEFDLALPKITTSEVTLTIRPEDPNSPVTITGGGPNSNYGLLRRRNLGEYQPK
jgi:hypothetical protein